MQYDNDYPIRISIYCKDQAHLRSGEAEPRRVAVTTFVKSSPDSGWQEVAGRTVRERRELRERQEEREREAARRPGFAGKLARKLPPSANRTGRVLPADEGSRASFRDEHGDTLGDNAPRGRLHHELTCKLCPGRKPGTRRHVRVRAENLDAALDTIVQAGLHEVSLASLCYTLEHKQD